ncbi:MAG: inositol monophosphatase family protein [Candidatus Nanoarchaeia archaeon]|jgi:histidinol-phosphatase
MEFLRVALEAVKAAEDIIMNYYQANPESSLKADNSLVTRADVEAERVIIETIKESFPGHNIIGEESGSDSKDSDYTWVIDPIDGTNSYSRGLPFFATQIALMKGDEVILGVSNAPALKELMYAEKGKGAFLNHERVRVSAISELSKSFINHGNIKYFKTAFEPLMKLTNSVFTTRGIGDFYGYHLVAQGKSELMIEARTKLWDIAAMKIIIEEAGGRVTDFKGRPITDKVTSIIASNGLIHDQVIELFND